MSCCLFEVCTICLGGYIYRQVGCSSELALGSGRLQVCCFKTSFSVGVAQSIGLDGKCFMTIYAHLLTGLQRRA